MDEKTIRSAIELLDAAVPREGARVRLRQYGGGPDESALEANEAGFLRLGIEVLKGARAAPRPDSPPGWIALDLDYLLTRDSNIVFDWIERTELPPDDSAPTPNFTWVPYVVIGGLGLFLLLALVGAIAVVRWCVG